MKKVVAVLVSVFLLATMIPLSAISVSAATRTRDEAVAWAYSKIGVGIDFDGQYGTQCVDLIFSYYTYLGVGSYGGNACDYAWNSLPSGWQRIAVTPGVTQLQSGDIGVWKTNYSYGGCSTGDYGHVGIIVDADNVGILAVDQPAGEVCQKNWYYQQMLQYVIRPSYVVPHTHSFGLWTATKGATCGTDGELIRTCGCGASETQAIPATGAHTYDDDYDATCNGCGATREVPEKPPVTPDLPADAPAFVVENVTAREGEEVTVAVRTQRNSGIVSLKLSVAYDADVLELVSVQEQDFAGVVFSPLASNPVIINWVDAIHPDNTIDGVVALLTFRVKDGAPIGVTDITLSYDPEDVYDANYDNVGFRVENGGVEVVDYLPGDVNGDGKINNKDLGVLQRYLSDWDVTVVELAADTNGDGKINNKDLGRLQQYLSDWDVELG